MSPIVMPIVSLLIDLFRKRREIRNVVVPLIATADGRIDLPNTKARREWVVGILVGRGLAESDARLLTEAGVKVWKRIQKKAAKRAAKGK